MKTAMTLGLLLIAAASPALAANTCSTLLSAAAQGVVPSEAQWRKDVTNSSVSTGIVPTSVAREDWLKSAKLAMEMFQDGRSNHGHADTPEMIFAAAEGVQTKAPAIATENKLGNTIPLNYTTNKAEQGFHYDRVPEVTVSGLGATGELRGTILLPASSHDGGSVAASMKLARERGATDKYDLRVEDSRGNVLMRLADRSPSLGLITIHEISLVLQPNQPVKLIYDRSRNDPSGTSSGGSPGGYMDGRVITIVWDGK